MGTEMQPHPPGTYHLVGLTAQQCGGPSPLPSLGPGLLFCTNKEAQTP